MALAVLLVAKEGYAQCAASFQGLGDLPGGDFWSGAVAVSADGSTVVGASRSTASGTEPEAFRWTESTGMVGLGDFPGGLFKSAASGVSHDGSVIVGQGSLATHGEAFRWTAETGLVAIGTLGGPSSVAHGVSSTGLVVVGWSHPAWPPAVPGTQEAFRWTSSTGMVSLGHLPGPGTYSIANVVSADGSIVVGYSLVDAAGCTNGCFEAFRWTEAEGMIGMGDLPGGSANGSANGISEDGSVITGWGATAIGPEAFRWTQAGGMVGLGDLPGGEFASSARKVSADGSVVVGSSNSAVGVEAFIWDANNGMRSIQEILVIDHGLDLEGWILGKAIGVSADGLTVVGWGTNPQGETEAWIVRLTLVPADRDGDGEVGVSDLLLLLAQWGPCPPVCLGDLNGDGVVNVPDLLELLGNWGSCP